MDTILYFRPKSGSNPEKLAGVLEIAGKARLHVQVIDEPPTRGLVMRLREFWKASGSIVECGGRTDTADPEVFRGSPVVFFNHSLNDLPARCFAVRHDSAGTGELAARELLSADPASFAYIQAPGNPFWSREREQGYRRALALNGKTPVVFEAGDGSQDATARNRALRAFLGTLRLPSAIFAANDSVAAEAITAARMLGLAIPEDLAILGVDNAAICEHTTPTLSSILPDFRRGGNLVMLTLLAIIHDGSAYRGRRQRAFGDLRVIRRLSTKRLQRPDPVVQNALDLIRREACEGLTAAAVAARFPCSRRMADKRFLRATGHSILSEIQSVRLERAKELLLNAHQQLKSISDFCGFENPNSLRKFFRKETGLTLGEWRRRAQGRLE